MKDIMRSSLLPVEEFLAELFEKYDHDPLLPFCYPYIVIEEGGEEKAFTLPEAVSEVLDTLPLSRGKRDNQLWSREKRVLELRFGLKDGRKRSYRTIGREVGGVSGPYIECMIRRAFRQLRYPSRSRKLREFLIPSPMEMMRKNKELEKTKEQFRQSEEARKQLIESLKGHRLEEIEGLKSEDLTQTTQFIEKDQEELNKLIKEHPNRRVWNAIMRSGGLSEPIRGFSQLKRVVNNGEIRHARYIGRKAEEFLKMVLQGAEPIKGAPS